MLWDRGDSSRGGQVRFSAASQLSQKQRDRIRNEYFSWVRKADYKKAFAVIKKYKKLYPTDFAVCRYYAAMLGDYAQTCRNLKQRRLHGQSIRLMRDLLRRTRCEPNRRIVTTLRNEYYYQTGQFKKQYELGVSTVRAGDRRGYYSQGVGAAWHAYGLAKKRQISRARKWARRAVTACQRYAKINPKYYNPYLHRAVAEGVLGRSSNVERSLRKAARLSGRKPSYPEFEAIRALVRTMLSASPGEM